MITVTFFALWTGLLYECFAEDNN